MNEWRRLRPSPHLTATILAAVQVQREFPDWTREAGRFIPNPSTWLHQGRWDDEPLAVTPSIFSSHSPKTAGNEAVGKRWVERMKAGGA